MKKRKILTRICTFTLAASLLFTNSSSTFAATASEEPTIDKIEPAKEKSSDEQLSPTPTVTTKENEQKPEMEQSNGTEVKPEAPDNAEENSVIPDEIEGNLEDPANTETTPTISDGTEEEPESSDGARRTQKNFDRADINPTFTPDYAAEGELETTSGIQVKDDNLIYFIDGTLYNGYYMNSAGVLYLVSNGIPEPANGMVNEGTPYYKLPSNENLILQAQTVFVNGQIYSGYFMDNNGVMYNVSSGAAALVTGTLKAKTTYYSFSKAKAQKLSKPTLYVKGKLYTGYYMNSKNRMYRAKKGSLSLVTGTLKAKAKYYSFNKAKTLKLSKPTLYVKGKLYTGYYINSKNRMYRAKKGSLSLVTGTLKAKAKYYSFNKAKTLRLSKPTLYVKGKLYTGYYINSRNTIYRAKKGSLTLITGMLGAGTKYYSYKAGKTQTLPKETLFVGGKTYTGYYLSPENRMYRAENGTCTLVNAALGAGTAYYNHNANGMQTLPAQTVFVNGKAMEGMSPESLATLQRAQAVVASITNDSMTMETKLQVCFDFVKTYPESRPRMPHYTGMDWPVIYANDMFVNGSGNCCSYAAAFAYMAKAIGYEEVYCCNSGGHGWAEINGLIYDPEWSKWHHTYNYYALSYDTPTDQDYKGAIGSGKPWMRIKI